MKENEIISKIATRFSDISNASYMLSIGDDAAVRICENEKLIFTTDTLVENVHFNLSYITLIELGYKAMAVNLSDVAAMGCKPDSALIQLTVPFGMSNSSFAIDSFFAGVEQSCREFKYPVVGGDLTSGPCWVIGITLIGRQSADMSVLTRNAAVAGDTLWVSGSLGKSAAGFAILEQMGRAKGEEKFPQLVRKHIAPKPCIDLGILLANDSSVHACIDISDGLSKEALLIAQNSNVKIIINQPATTLLDELSEASHFCNKESYDWFLHGGEEYELLFTAGRAFDHTCYGDYPLISIGQVVNGEGLFVYDRNKSCKRLKNCSFDHFSL